LGNEEAETENYQRPEDSRGVGGVGFQGAGMENRGCGRHALGRFEARTAMTSWSDIGDSLSACRSNQPPPDQGTGNACAIGKPAKPYIGGLVRLCGCLWGAGRCLVRPPGKARSRARSRWVCARTACMPSMNNTARLGICCGKRWRWSEDAESTEADVPPVMSSLPGLWDGGRGLRTMGNATGNGVRSIPNPVIRQPSDPTTQ
jgi:hypothetical protein